MAKGMGRRRGSRNRGYFFREGRGWHAKPDGKFVPLEFPNGDRMRDKDTPVAEVRAAYHRLLSGTPAPDAPVDDGVTIFQICEAYLAKAESEGAKSTLTVRQNTLFDFCVGLPSRFIPGRGTEREKPKPNDYFHDGYGTMSVGKLRPIHIDQWLQSHPNWNGSAVRKSKR